MQPAMTWSQGSARNSTFRSYRLRAGGGGVEAWCRAGGSDPSRGLILVAPGVLLLAIGAGWRLARGSVV
jgi:hypothetical protein